MTGFTENEKRDIIGLCIFVVILIGALILLAGGPKLNIFEVLAVIGVGLLCFFLSPIFHIITRGRFL
ncbi:MAG: hypothetical protein A3B75_03100 [Candidatus Terrybacteria bacterium RIFCSPHIGHO2_02_FULL_43_14]|uniref:Uncharacterized protein n=1 Tax=Candidatus Terrybacteria bacterium RIFCSPHIGHO2_01_FULL_43_35 TaxID=1802361 RepID=A0A1G2PFL7_9BACT|nr:MAG: hypothetical protein A2828_04200 [Candidatus Terrybacteria bacterium RIFCSPHIGHO2_01_FULL_43_35]OHA49869.1 MAG: hypothetical protein A3B75_03100 [Candidatus Terrybacteria bacterium RIFCSPHIGHO2_02_FULL_43_14]